MPRLPEWLRGPLLATGLLVVAQFVASPATAWRVMPAVGAQPPGSSLAEPFPGVPGLGGDAVAGGSTVSVEAVVEPAPSGPVLAVTATIEAGWHTYAIDQKPGGPKPTRITVLADAPWLPAGPFKPDVAPHSRTVDDVPGWEGLKVEEHSGRITWRAPLLANPTGKAATIQGAISVQLCRDGSCTPPESFPFSATVPAGETSPGAVAPSFAGLPGTVATTIATHLPPRAHAGIEAAFAPARDVALPDGSMVRGWPLVVRLSPDDGFHLYAPAAAASSEVGQGKPTLVAVNGVEPAGVAAVAVIEATRSQAGELAAANGVDGPVTLEILLPTAGGDSAAVTIGFQTCTESSCDPPTAVRLLAKFPAGSDVDSGSVEFAAAKYAEAAKSPLAISVSPSAGLPAPPAAGDSQPSAVPAAAGTARLSLPMALLSGLIGGLILNLMPCVLPVLGLKLMSFAQQSGRARQEVFQMNLWYCAGLYAVFFVLATASVAANIGLGSRNLAWGEQFTSSSFNITMAAIVFAFALSFLGVWELPIPGFIGEKAGHVQSKEGPLGAFLKGVLSTILATPCSGPFLGPVIGFTLSQPTAGTYAVFGAIATGMALPYLVVGMVPGIAKYLPRPGTWMETLKEILGFVMLGTVVFLFTFLNHVWFVPTFALLIGIWAACWWIGKGQEASGGVAGPARWLQAAGVAAAIGFLAFTFLGPVKSIIPWEPFSRARLAELRSGGTTVLVDFSADWCMTCKLNLATAIETTKVKSAIESNRVVPLLADWTEESSEIKSMLESLQSKSIPVLAIFPAAKPGQPAPEPIILRDLITESQVLAAIQSAGPSQNGPPEMRARSARQEAPGKPSEPR